MDYEKEYNNSARVAGAPAIIESWVGMAANYRAASNPTLDQSYGEDPRHIYDLFRAGGSKDGTCIVFIHGGYWQRLDKNSFSHIAAGMNAHGYDVAIPSYRLCPAAEVRDIIDDMRAFCRALGETGYSDLVVCGHSAGGHLTACMLADTELPQGLVRAAMPISGLFDLPPLVGTSVNDALGLDEAAAREASPMFGPAPGGKTMHAFVGGDESAEYHRQSRELAQNWSAAGVNARWDTIPATNHFTVIASLAEPEGILTQALCALASK